MLCGWDSAENYYNYFDVYVTKNEWPNKVFIRSKTLFGDILTVLKKKTKII